MIAGERDGLSVTASAAAVYRPAGDLACVMPYFNGRRYRRRLTNFLTVHDSLARSGQEVFVVECAFNGDPFRLPVASAIQVRANSLLWQKERLINLALERLPKRFRKIAWIDGDVLLEDEEWPLRLSRALDRHPVAQPFDTVIRLVEDAPDPRAGVRLPRHCMRRPGVTRGIAATVCSQGSAGVALDPEECRHGDCGFAWGARREVLEGIGLYDGCVVGGGDHMIAHAMYGWQRSPCITRNLFGRHLADYRHWSDAFGARVAGDVTFLPGRVFHLWHGEHRRRQYGERHDLLRTFAYDPAVDVRRSGDGCWEWTSGAGSLGAAVVDYFAGRREDG